MSNIKQQCIYVDDWVNAHCSVVFVKDKENALNHFNDMLGIGKEKTGF